ncbi:PKD domain-containing protein, partial [Candidatus Bipolaricaulota bacterium]|nr:PKD domain-containing protein [Candidatus Bipolaricaulota bacterium]
RAAEGTIIRHAWDFGDGESTALGAIVTHTYQQARYYTVTLTVHDDSGQQASASWPIEIRPNSQ